jgi:phenylacetic acid degradation protein paaD
MTETVQARPSQEEIEEALKEVIDPELGVNIVDLGLLYGMRWDDNGVLILDLTLTTAACPLQDVIEEQVEANLDSVVTEWRVNWVWMPPWGARARSWGGGGEGPPGGGPERITEDGRDMMRALGFNI